MDQTSNYKLPRWVEEDRIMMEDFNKAFESIENGLTEIKAAAEGAATAAAAGQQGVSDLTPRVTAVEQAVKFVKLAGPTVTTAANQAVTFDMSEIDMGQYTALLVFVSGGTSSGEMEISVNGSSVTKLAYNNWSSSSSIAWVRPNGDGVLGSVLSGSSGTSSAVYGGYANVAWSAVKSVSISGQSYAGLNCVLYGIKE